MWKRGGRSSALDRAEALLSTKKSSTGAAESTRRSAATTRAPTDAVNNISLESRSAPPNPRPLDSDLSDLSSVSSVTESRANTARHEKIQGREVAPTTAPRPQSSLEGGGGGGSRFLKKVPPSLANSTQSLETRSVPSSQRSSQTAVINRLAQIESRLRSRQQTQEHTRQDLSPPSPPETERRPVSAPSSSDESLKGKRFLKKKSAAGAATPSPIGPNHGRVLSRASAGLEKRSKKVVSGVSLESDEEDMRKLLGDSVDLTDESLLATVKASSVRKVKKEVTSRPPPTAVGPSPPRSPASPFRFNSQVRKQFSPSALSSSPSPPRISSSLTRKSPQSQRAESPERSFSSLSGNNEVHSLEELFPTSPNAEDSRHEISSVSSTEFNMNVMTIDDLVPATFEVTEETPTKERNVKHNHPVPGSQRGNQQQVEEENMFDYQSDFESEIRTEMDNRAKEVSENSPKNENRAWNSDSERTEYDYSSSFSDSTQSSESFSQSRGFKSFVSHSSRMSGQREKGSASFDRKNVKDTAVQTQPNIKAYAWSAGTATFDPQPAVTNGSHIPMAAYILSTEKVDSLSTFNPATIALREVLKQHLTMTRRFIESSRRLHYSQVQSLEPPSYRYTTLEGTMEYIRKYRSQRLTVEEA